MNRRDAVFSLLETPVSANSPQTYIPAAFFLHFGADYRLGPPAVARHREFFRATGMDLVKIQYEETFPSHTLQRPADWANLPALDEAFFAPQLAVVRGLVEELKAEAPVVVTLYSPFMCAGYVGGTETLMAHLQEDPEPVKQGLQILAESLLVFVRACIRLGVDGFYHSTQGGESRRFQNAALFTDVIKPSDLAVMREINERCPFNILHICDYHRAEYGGYDDLTPFLDYPGQIVNCNLQIGEGTMTAQEVSTLFGRPFMGGMDRLAELATGTKEQVRAAAREALAARSERFFLAADCTVPGATPWANLSAAIEEAHRVHPTN
jgi:uroporphyrinogen decarboxylase